MMDGRALFPQGWHPQASTRLPNGRRIKASARNPSRAAAGGVRYYFIDFGLATHDEDQVTGILGQERAPELSGDGPYNPYKLDVYIMGMAFQHFFIEV